MHVFKIKVERAKLLTKIDLSAKINTMKALRVLSSVENFALTLTSFLPFCFR